MWADDRRLIGSEVSRSSGSNNCATVGAGTGTDFHDIIGGLHHTNESFDGDVDRRCGVCATVRALMFGESGEDEPENIQDFGRRPEGGPHTSGTWALP